MLFNSFSKNIILPLSDWYTGWQIGKSYDFLIESQWWDKKKLRDYQNKKFIELISHAYNTVPFYNKSFKKNGIKLSEIKDLSDINKIPILTKEDINSNFSNAQLLSDQYKPKNVLIKRSSGSTGKKTIYYIIPEAYGFNIAANLRGWSWMGYTMGDKTIKISQNKRHSVLKKLQDSFDRVSLFANTYDANSYKKFIMVFQKYKPLYLRSYPDPLFFLASWAKKENRIFKGLHSINTTGNILFPEVRKLVEEVFSTKVFDSYSCEGGPVVFECPSHNCYHIAMEYGYAEIIDEKGKEVKPGETGKMIVTDLHNFATPFIRYNSQDYVIKGGKCTCGREHDTILSIQGRDNDILVTPSGQFLIAQTFTTYFKYFNCIDHFQVHQPEVNKLIFNLQTTNDYDKEIENRIIADWKNKTNNQMSIIINKVESIDLLQSGKRRFLIRDPKIKITIS